MTADAGDVLVELIIDGVPYDIVVQASDEAAAVRLLEDAMVKRARASYRRPEGSGLPPLHVEWRNVATLRFGDVAMVRDYRPNA